MSKCPFCQKILSDDWVKRQGASIMGKKGGAAKARSREQTQAAARSRWGTKPLRTAEELREANCARQRKYQATHKAKKEFERLCAELAAEAALLGKTL